MAFNLPPPLSTFRSLAPSPPPGKKKVPSCYKEKLANTIFISVPSLCLSLPSLSYPCQLLYHFNEYSPGNGLISVAKYLFLSGIDLVCLKPTVRTDRLSALRSSKAMMLSAVSCNTDEWRGSSGGWSDRGDGVKRTGKWDEGGEKKNEWIKKKWIQVALTKERMEKNEWKYEEGGGKMKWTCRSREEVEHRHMDTCGTSDQRCRFVYGWM